MVAHKAASNLSPYKEAVARVLVEAGAPGEWPYGSLDGEQSCASTLEPAYLANGSPRILAQAMAYHLTGKREFAAAVRERLLDLTDTYGYGGEKYGGANRCILNLAWYLPGFIQAADLIEDFRGWTSGDKRALQHWLAREVYKKVDGASDKRSNNWGSAGSATAAMIADYVAGSGELLLDRDGNRWSPQAAYDKAKQRQLDRVNGNRYMDNYNCRQPVGIRADGGIPEELARGTTGCDGLWIRERDASWTYTQTYLQGTILHAELLLRRGDRSLYENIAADGSGSLVRAIHFLIQNPKTPGKSVGWSERDKPSLEVTYRYYRDAASAAELRVGQRDRFIGHRSRQMLHFGTVTHGFAPGEKPGPPPTVPPPGETP